MFYSFIIIIISVPLFSDDKIWISFEVKQLFHLLTDISTLKHVPLFLLEHVHLFLFISFLSLCVSEKEEIAGDKDE